MTRIPSRPSACRSSLPRRPIWSHSQADCRPPNSHRPNPIRQSTLRRPLQCPLWAPRRGQQRAQIPRKHRIPRARISMRRVLLFAGKRGKQNAAKKQQRHHRHNHKRRRDIHNQSLPISLAFPIRKCRSPGFEVDRIFQFRKLTRQLKLQMQHFRNQEMVAYRDLRLQLWVYRSWILPNEDACRR